jgi:hypothetical protein
VREREIVGTLFSLPVKPQPGVIVLSCSEGGLNEYLAATLASDGFTTLALAYFNFENLPNQLCEIPLEYFERTIDWFLQQELHKSGRPGDQIAGVGRRISGVMRRACKRLSTTNPWSGLPIQVSLFRHGKIASSHAERRDRPTCTELFSTIRHERLESDFDLLRHNSTPCNCRL